MIWLNYRLASDAGQLAEIDRRRSARMNKANLAARCERHSMRARPIASLVFLLLLIGTMALSATAQAQYTPPPTPPPPSSANASAPPAPPSNALLSSKQLDHLVARIALYPDSLLAQVLAASTYADQIPPAAQCADEHGYLKGDALADAIRADNLNWDPSVLALLPFPSVLDMMAHDMSWTQQLGQAVLNQRPDVMDAVQRMRKKAYDYGYLRSDPYDQVVVSGGYIEVLPVNPAYVYVPTYDPALVFGPPPPGFFVGGAIHFGPAVVITAGFFPWGWAHPYFAWDRPPYFPLRQHAVVSRAG
jgi:Protein of unknown function (DUF3300)